MPVTPCAPCDCIPGTIPDPTFKQDVERILCQILAAILGSGGAGENVNLVGINGVAPAVNNGIATAGTLRVTVASDSTGQIRLAAGAAVIGSLVANQSVNVAQIAGTATATGNGVTTAGTQRVTISSDSTGTVIATQATASNLNAQVVGNIAHDGVDAGNPVKIGQKAISYGTTPTAVASGDRTDLYADRAGVSFILGGHPDVVTLLTSFTGSATNSAFVTVGAGSKIVVTEIEALCANANTNDTGVIIGFGTANTPTTTGVVLSHPGIAAGSGVIRGSGAGILGVGADNEDLRITTTDPGGQLDVLVTYFVIAG